MNDSTNDRTDIDKVSKTAFQDLFHNASERMARIDSQGLILSVNARFSALFGYEQETMIGMSLASLCDVHDRNKFSRLCAELEEVGRVAGNLKTITRQGDTLDTQILLIKGITKTNSFAPSYCFIEIQEPGISVLETGDPQKSNMEDRFRLISDFLPLTLTYLDKDLHCQYVNQLFLDTFATGNRQLIGEHYADIVGEQHYEDIKHHLQIAQQGNRVAFEFKLDVNNSLTSYEVNCVPDLDKPGNVRGIYILSEDVTEKHHSRIREMRLGHILENSLNEIYIFDSNSFRFSHVNMGARKNLGYSMEELNTMTPADITREHSQKEILDYLQPLLEHKQEKLKFITRHYRKDGSCYDVSSNIQMFDIGGQCQFVAMVEDISERIRAEQELVLSRDIIHSSHECFAYINTEHRYVYVNDQFCKLVGRNKSDVLGNTVAGVLGEDIFDIVKPFYEQAFSGHSARTQLWLSYPHNECFVDASYSPSLDKEGEVIAVVVTIRDMTELETTRQAAVAGEERFRLITLSANDALYDWDLINNTVWRNDKDLNNFYSTESMTDWTGMIHPDEREYVNQTFEDAVEKCHHQWSAEYRLKQNDGSYINVYDRAHILYDSDNKPCRVIGAMVDISHTKKAETALRSSEERFRTLYENNPLMLFTLDSKGKILSTNNQVSSLLGYGEILLIDEIIFTLIDKKYRKLAEEALITCIANRSLTRRIEFEIIHKWQGPIWIRSTLRAIQDSSGQDCVLMVCEDISETRQLAQKLSYQASHDSLTGLVNRNEFERRLKRIVSNSSNSTTHALCYLDLDQFKIVNDTCGHLAGDELLRQISNILKSAVRKRDTLARLGGDEFGILMEHCTLDQAQRVANGMRKSIEEFRFVWEGQRFILGVSIGLVPIDSAKVEVKDMLREADVACYAAKDAGRNRVHIYTSEDKQSFNDYGQQVQWAARINHALEEDQFRIFHQTIQASSPDVVNDQRFEILLRMIGENNKVIAPGAFMPAAERYNLSAKIDTWVFDAITTWMQNNPQQLENISMCSINISGHTIADEKYHDFVVQKLYETRLPPEKICFEITETVAISNISMALQLIHTLKEVGCQFALDDFGSGVSSFGYLKQLPVDYIKIDGTFVRDIVDDPIDFEMVRSIHDIAQVMGLKTIAEFVENDNIRNKLSEIGVDYLQGYGIGRPVSIS